MRLWLKTIRAKKSQESIANQSGISQQMYSWIERGARTPSVDVAKKIAAVLGFDWVMFFDDNINTDETQVYYHASQLTIN